MPLIINELPKREDKVITMGKQPEADYYPPGATEPQVRPADVSEPEEEPEEEEAAEPKKAAAKPGKKK